MLTPTQATGLTLPKPQQATINGLMTAKPLSTLLAEEAAAKQASFNRASEANNAPLITSLAGHIRHIWSIAKQAKEPTVERDMLAAVRARRGEYSPEKLARIKEQGGSDIYMMIFATKARQFKALLVDVLIGDGTNKPWTIAPTPNPELPQEEVQKLLMALQERVAQAEMAMQPMSVDDIAQMMRDAKDTLTRREMDEARREAERAERMIEDDMVQGGFMEALDQFIDDLTVFKTAFIKGPIVRMENALKWVPGPDGTSSPTPVRQQKLVWERVDPLMMYPAPWARTVNDAPLIERHRLSRADLGAMIGVDGYSEDAIRAVLDAHGSGGLHEWLNVDVERTTAESRESDAASQSDLIDALQFWGSVSGKMLREWGLTEEEVTDEATEYEVEAWLIGGWVVKAVLNPDPLLRRPYYADGFSRIPGAFWNNSLYDVVRDHEDMCNAAARALSSNLGISSGPQVVVNIDRVAAGEDITELYPWKIHQVTSDPMGGAAPPITFFQPSSNVSELMTVFERFSQLADEVSGIPKYMAGLSGGEGGAGRTASGMSMMVTAAGKQVKNSLSSIDIHVLGPAVERAYQWKLQYDQTAKLRGDLNVRARGALSLVAKETANVRLNEFLAATGNPIDMQIIGMGGRAELLRHAVRRLDINTDKVVPSETEMKAQVMAQQQMAMQQQAMMQQQQGQPQQPQGGGNVSGQELMDGAPVVDNFSPTPSP